MALPSSVQRLSKASEILLSANLFELQPVSYSSSPRAACARNQVVKLFGSEQNLNSAVDIFVKENVLNSASCLLAGWQCFVSEFQP